jgi:ABC-type bacteriocin/lantibiotic exporter with double-glycine peptidase domain
MKTTELNWILQLITSYYRIEYSASKINKVYHAKFSKEEDEIFSSINQFIEVAKQFNLSVLRYKLNASDLRSFLKQISSPTILYKEETQEPFVITESEGKFLKSYWNDFDDRLITTDEVLEMAYKENGKYVLLVSLPISSLFSDETETDSSKSSLKGKPLRRFFKLLSLEKREIGYIYAYAIMSGLVYLSLPLGIQAIIGLIMSGQVSTSVVVLISFVLIGIAVSGGLQIMQITMIEYLQRRLFTRAAFEFAFRIPKIKLESIVKEYAPELMNRFFDIISVQKGLSKLLLDFSTAIIQIVFGLFLLSFYHSFFILFGLLLIIVLSFIIWLTGPKGLETSLKKSKYKYQVAHWIEELARSVNTFKLAGFTNLPLEKTDHVVTNYLYARKKHFKILLFQFFNIVGFKILVTGGLLIIGSQLVINREINIGQFVAAEIIIILILSAVEKILISLEVIYEVLTSVEKIGSVTDLPLEDSKGFYIEDITKDKKAGFNIEVKNLSYRFPEETENILDNIDLTIPSGARNCISGYNGSGKSTFVNVLCGLYESYTGEISYEKVPMKDINKNSLRWHIGDNLSQEDIFEGTLYENISLGRQNIPFEDVVWASEAMGLGDFVRRQKHGYHTPLIASGKGLPGSFIKKIFLARSIVQKPKLLILDDHLNMEKAEKQRILNYIFDKKYPWTVLIISNDPAVMKLCDNIFVLKEGRIIDQGTFEEVSEKDYFKDIAYL